MAPEPMPPTRRVWDLPLRVAHWALVVCVAGSFATHYAGIEWFPWHRRFGYATLVLVAFRIAWGVVGTRHARFTSFVRGPRAVVDYLRGRWRPGPGHNPLGALSVLAMLAVLLVQAGTGLFANDEIANAGPFYGWVSPATSHRVTGWHHLNSDLLIGLVVLHLLAVAWYVRVRRLPLVRAMLTGRKPDSLVADGEAIEGSRSLLAALIVVVLAAALAIAIRAAPEATLSLF